MAKIYWLCGQPASGKTILGKKLHDFLQTEKRNWRKDVFHIDGDNLRQLTNNTTYSESGRDTNVKNAQLLAKYLHSNECDVVVSLVAPYRDIRESFKHEMGNDMVEIFLHADRKTERDSYHVKDYQIPINNFVSVDTTKPNIDRSFSKLINKLHHLNKL